MKRDIICKILVTTLFLTLLAGTAYTTDVNLNSSIDARELADKLTADGWVLYGTDQCPWCVRQKDEFGDAFANVTHIDCNKNEQACRN
ncbi:MAG: hypothetical protein U9Q37_10630, partial [Euryarchaeota archaeon]|nr:hypothetical protein [Euryarchaeota archaeon]